jgi:hypothetical protein
MVLKAARIDASSHSSGGKPVADRRAKRDEAHAALLQPSSGRSSEMVCPSSLRGKRESVASLSSAEAKTTRRAPKSLAARATCGFPPSCSRARRRRNPGEAEAGSTQAKAKRFVQLAPIERGRNTSATS